MKVKLTGNDIFSVYFYKKEQWCAPIAIDLLISTDNYQFSREVIPDYIEFVKAGGYKAS